MLSAITRSSMSETAIKANQREAAHLYQRGVAAARGGQRRLASTLLRRVVQLDPQHELGWLWLSGTLDDPEQVAFCLRTVLTLNPVNEFAQRGQAQLARQARLAAQVPPVQVSRAALPTLPTLPAAPAAPAAATSGLLRRIPLARIVQDAVDDEHARSVASSWWVGWRQSRRDLRRVRVIFWAVPIMLLLLTLWLNANLGAAVERNERLATEAQARLLAPPTAAPSSFVPQPGAPRNIEFVGQSSEVADARAMRYLSEIAPQRAALSAAIVRYREATGRAGVTSLASAAEARRLREQVEVSRAALAALDPPPELASAHATYLLGLEREGAALDDLLEFYSSFRIDLANRATIRMSEANDYLSRARSDFAARSAATGALAAQTMR